MENNIYLCHIKQYDMEVVFEKDYLQEMYKTGKTTDKKHRFQPAIIRKYIRVIDIMIN